MVQYVVFGVVDGAFLLLATLGFALVSRVHKFLNIAHAELMSVAALLSWGLSAVAGLPFLLAAAIAIVVVAGLGLLVGRTVYEPILSRGPEVLLIVSVGVVYLIHGVTEGIVSPGTKSYDIPRLGGLEVAGIRVTYYQLMIVALAACCFIGLHLFLSRTSAGSAIRAIADDRELAEVRGIDVRRATRYVWLVASALAAVAGVSLGVLGTLTTDIAFEQILLILSVAILAGLGSIYGVAVAAFVLGLAMDLSTMVIPSGYRAAVAFLVIIIVLIVRPQGLFGRRVRTA